jgi:hypothetical protein
MVELLRVPVQHVLSEQAAGRAEPVQDDEHGSRSALVVDDSLTARRAAANVL